MDPTKYMCEISDSFSNKKININTLIPFKYNNHEIEKVKVLVETKNENNVKDENIILIDKDQYYELQKLKDQFDNPNFENAKLIANPFENIGKSIFMNRAAIKLANIDAIFNLTQQDQRYISQKNLKSFKYCDIAGGPGGFTEYLQYRLPNSYGYGITLHEKNGGIPWIEDRLDKTRFDITYGFDGTGNLYTNYDWFSEYVNNKEGINRNINLVVADGGFEIGNDARNQEILSSHLILSEILIALQILAPGGNFVCKIFDTISKISADLIFILSICFREIHIFKPVSSRPANAERYLIGLGIKQNISFYIKLLQSVNSRYINNEIVTSIFNILPSNFENWLYTNNLNNLRLQRETTDNIITLLSKGKVDIPEYNLHKCLIIWNLPSNKPSKFDKIKVY